MHIIIGLLALAAGILFFVLRANSAVKAARELDRDTKGLQRRFKHGMQSLIGTPLGRVGDARLAATILMIQLVRTGTPVTAAEKTKILELMDDPLGIKDASAMFEKAWGYTEPRAFFSGYVDELLPLLRDRLNEPERQQLVAMLTDVANAYGEASELQREAIVRLEKRLLRL
ncbi:MAG: TerB family tellurite resistance protein [Hyphomicrobiaceae bacterium]